MNDASHNVYIGRATNWVAFGLVAAAPFPLIAAGAGSHDSWTAPDFLLPAAPKKPLPR
jgi:hypothetical protein